MHQAQDIVGYRFSSPDYLRRALTHRSWAHEHGSLAHNERLELLGDAVIGLVVTEDIFRRFADMAEGELTQLKSFLVSRRLQARAARNLGLEACLLIGASEEKSGITARISTLANVFEAVVGAIYLDGGLAPAAEFLRRTILCDARAPSHLELKDPKTELQELIQGREPIQPKYRLLAVCGPDHLPVFTVEVAVGGRVLARGTGPTKKEAEKEAARAALSLLEVRPPGQEGGGEPGQ